ncbi:reverse transcriptase domain-containing protein [Tanacetum coccineum]
MRTRSQARRRRQPQVRQTSVESSNLEKPDNPPIVTMADNRTMAQLLEAPTEGYEDAIVIPEITANNFEIKHGLLNLVQNKQFFGNDKEDPHAHIRYFNKITSTMKIPNVPNTSVKLMLFPFSLEGAARIWLEKEPPRSIETWDDLVSKFINKFFPPSKTTNLRNEITRFQQKFDETFYEAWDRFNDLLRGCPHHGFSELHQLDTFYNSLNSIDQDSLNSAAGGNFLDKMPRECLKIIESKSKVRQSRNKAVVAKMSTSSSTQAVSSDVAELKDMVRALILDRKNQTPASAPVKAVEQSCVTCGGGHSYQNCPATNSNIYHDNIQEYVSQAAAANFNQANSGYRPLSEPNIITFTSYPKLENKMRKYGRSLERRSGRIIWDSTYKRAFQIEHLELNQLAQLGIVDTLVQLVCTSSSSPLFHCFLEFEEVRRLLLVGLYSFLKYLARSAKFFFISLSLRACFWICIPRIRTTDLRSQLVLAFSLPLCMVVRTGRMEEDCLYDGAFDF